MLTAFIHLFSVPLILISAVATYFNWRKGKFQKKTIKFLFLFFVFLTFYQLSLSLPYLFSGGNLRIVGGGYSLAVVFLFLAINPMIELEMVFVGASQQRKKIVKDLFAVAGLAIVGWQIYKFQLPVADESGFIFWNANPVSAWLTAITGFLVSILLTAQIVRRWPRDLGTVEKIKSFLFCSGAIAWGISSIIYYPSHSIFLSAVSAAAAYAGAILILTAVLFPGRKEERV